MSRRTDNSPVISFFSFQDIITSVTGIMFLIVLILILMLLTHQNMATPQEREEIRDTEELKRELARLGEEFDNASSVNAKLEQRFRELMELDLAKSEETLPALKAELRKMEQENNLTLAKISRTKDDIDLTSSTMDELKRNIVQAKEMLDSLLQKDAMLDAKIQEMEKQIQAAKKTVRFTWQRTSTKKPILVECEDSCMRIGNYNADKPLATFTADDKSALMDSLLKWLGKYPDSDYYVLLLVKPSAFKYAEELSARLKQKGYERGREVLPNDAVQIFKEGN